MAPGLAKAFISELLYENPQLDLSSLDLAQTTRDAQKTLAPVINPTPDLRAARNAGKKVILYSSWSDSNIQGQYSSAYVDAVQKTVGRNTGDFLRMFMVPGWWHCGGDLVIGGQNSLGVTPIDPQHDVFSALQHWVESGVAPDKLIATQYKTSEAAPVMGPRQIAPGTPIERTRLLCIYPQVAKYKGRGDTNDASNFACVAP